MTNEEKDRITERVRFENELRATLAPPRKETKSGLWGVLNSSLGILLATSLMTSFLVPQFQRKQHDLDWQRQIRAENMKFRLGMMRECLTEFTLADSLTAEAYERSRPLAVSPVISPALYGEFTSRFTDIQNRRFEKNARVSALLVHFPNRKDIANAIGEHEIRSSEYMRALERFVRDRYQSGAPGGLAPDKLAEEENATRDVTTINATYDAAIQKMTEEIHSEEARYESLKF